MRKLLIGIAGLMALPVVVLLALPYITNLTAVRDRVTMTASATLQHPVTIAHLSLRALPRPGLQIEDLSITERDGLPIVNVKKIVVEVELGPLLQRRLVVARILVGEPRISLLRNADASLNLPLPASAPVATPESGGQPFDIFLEDVRVENGELTVRERQKQREPPLLHVRKVHAVLSDLSVHGKTKDDFNRSLTGTVRMEAKEGAIGNVHILTQILSLLKVTQVLGGKIPDLSRVSIPIESLAGTFRFKNGLMTTNDLTLKSPVLDAAFKGTFNVPDKQMKMVATAMGIDFDVQGSAADPSVSLHTMKGLREGIGGLIEKGLGLFR